MSLRDYLNNNSSVMTIVAVVVLVIAVGIIVMTNKPKPPPGQHDVYFYDLNTGKLFTAVSDLRPPIDTPSGPTKSGNKAGVLAYVTACGECKNYDGMGIEELKANNAYISRLEMFTPESFAALERVTAMSTPPATTNGAPPTPTGVEPSPRDLALMNAMVVQRPGDAKWVPMESSQGMAIINNSASGCPAGTAHTCLPGS